MQSWSDGFSVALVEPLAMTDEVVLRSVYFHLALNWDDPSENPFAGGPVRIDACRRAAHARLAGRSPAWLMMWCATWFAL